MPIWGTWYNELGSVMELQTGSGSAGTLNGTYWSAVGQATYQYPLRGTYDTNPVGSGGQAAGWSVAWKNAYMNAHSNTAWAGQYQMLNGQEQIYTFWLLASSQTPENDWQATNIGQDTFTRNPPSAETIQRRRQAGHLSHPIAAEKGE